MSYVELITKMMEEMNLTYLRLRDGKLEGCIDSATCWFSLKEFVLDIKTHDEATEFAMDEYMKYGSESE